MVKDGKKPISLKQKTTSVSHDDIFGNALSLSPELKKDLEDQGLVPRFVDYKRLKEMDGYHEKGWEIYKKKNSAIIGKQEFKFGSTPDGVVRRGSMVLAVKTKEAAEKHRAYLRQKAERYRRSFTNRKAEELRKLAKEGNVDTNVVEGYDD